ncbi:MAG: hypothetical protein EBR23_02925 [Planctomycetia bacterium]|jgi:hypothetical protein|nr:hypothetical protein [Planctomycetia bacterium]
MLQKNPLQPPRPYAPRGETVPATVGSAAAAFVSASDFDGTGILAGIDPCESRYWWIPELYAPEALAPERPAARASQALAARLRSAGQAARDVPTRSTAAA